MGKRLLIVSTLDSSQPFGAFTRPFYLGQYLTRYFDVFQLGLDCSSVNYAPSISIGSRSLKSYIQTIEKCIDEFCPDIVYAQETLPGLAALISLRLRKRRKSSLVLDFHTFSAYEYWMRLFSVANPFKEFVQCIKTYIAQGILIFSGSPIIAAGDSIPKLIYQWYGKTPQQIYSIGNGVTEDLLNTELFLSQDPYQAFRPAKIVVLIAPKTFQFPSNDMSVSMTIQIAKHIENHQEKIHFVVIGRDSSDISEPIPSNISFLGFFPKREDFVKHVKYADIALLPFSKQAVAGGARNKALDYFASRKLVVSTPEGLRGLEEFRHLEHLLVTGYSTEEVANTVLDAASNFDKYQSIVDTAYTLITEKYSWNARAQNIAQIIMEVSCS
ncbi:glycosyltransferase family 4 protein [Nostoc muscorum FACHB-395]|jgi:glycosyltransferase involved in cell wall biosynthesis|uniref:glycosyltransferase n=1 Tax=Nostoc sp. C057 TaxID=2576903 RepID=UPI0015C33894|nr:glycosyltransferase [Nostoc sp. C057]MBD2511218.1 glycosyltransferase family 4 protein [Desmonostoc muscorum FACHB-395]QLE51780.1 glycosyltransferase family 4 protein [Nostoc sp. C057]